MHLVEPEEVGPIEGDDPRITPPRPPHRRVSVSLLFTFAVLIGVVVTIYLVLPARHNVLLTEAIDRHRDTQVTWDLEAPTMQELRAWAIGVIGKDVPLPADATTVIGAKRVHVLRRDAALMRLQIGGDQITYLVQGRARGIAPKHDEKVDGDLRARAWRRGKFTCVAVGPETSSSTWLAVFSTK
ncbi:MAG TPA: hypothetical protein VIV11_16285 [Kofleriaceae bacterium]